jgi:DhnA family fructose-bisphosphate aldolase class Ia/sugar phosphate isomerase/epimerase
MVLEKNPISIVHFMAFPGPGQSNVVSRGEAPAWYLLETIKFILDDPYFSGIEITQIKDPALRKEVAELLAASGKNVIYSAQPVQLINEENIIAPTDISSSDELERRKAVARLERCIDEAYELGATSFGLISGKDPGTENGLRLRNAAMEALVRSLNELCNYAKAKAKELGKKPLDLCLEQFDRLDEPNCKNLLVGPSNEAIGLARRLRDHYRQDNFWLLYDLSHAPLLKNNSFDGEDPSILRELAPYLGHVHVGSCVLDRNDPAFGDSHPGFDYPGGAVSADDLAQFVATLNELGYDRGIGFEVAPQSSDELSETLVSKTKAFFDEARQRLDVNYALGGFAYSSRTFFPERLFSMLTDLRVNKPQLIHEEAQKRKQRKELTREDGKLLILACDHPGRHVTNVGSDPVGMGDRLDYLSRILRVMVHPEVDGVMATPDIIEDLLLVNYLVKDNGGDSFLDEKVLLGCMNRAGLAGASFEMDDRMTAYTAESMLELKVDGAKMMFRLDLNAKYSGRTVVYCARAINDCNKYNLPVFLEPLPVEPTASGYKVKMNMKDLIKTIGVASALGDSSRNLWLKIPYVENYHRVVRATSLPILMLGGASTGNPLGTLEQFQRGLGAGPNVRGAMVGRNVLYPGLDDPQAVAVAIGRMIHDNYNLQKAVSFLASSRGANMGELVERIK